jgi:Tol biopolymer transport system component
MTRHPDFDRRIKTWVDEAAVGAIPDGFLENVLDSTRERHQRPAWIVAIRGGGMGTTARLGGRPIRRFAYLTVIAVLVLALAAAILLVGAGTRHLGGNGPIVFYRTDDARSTNTPFMVDPNGSHETALHDGGLLPGIWSPDGRKLAVTHLVPDASPLPGAETAWIRPAVVNPDGSGFRILDAYPHRKMQLSPVAWSPDGSRIFVQSGGEDVDPADLGLYTIRASDGGDLARIVMTPKGYNDHTAVSPDGSRVLVGRSRTAVDGTLFVVNMDGTGRHELTPPHANAVDLQFYDGISDAWSPDGSRIAFCAFTDSNGSTGLFVVNPDGTDLKQIVPMATGAISVQWSPDGKLLAFTSEVGPDDQIAVIRPDGTSLMRLTDGTDGSTSVAPVWSPDGTKLLFQRKLGRQVTLWTMNADGSGQTQLTPTPVAADWVGGYAWGPLPAR